MVRGVAIAIVSPLYVACGFSSSPVEAIPDAIPSADAPEVTPDAPIDAAPDSLQVPSCPDGYITIAGSESKYRVVIGGPMGAPYWTHYDDCEDDLEGATHLIVLNSRVELDQVLGVLDNAGTGFTRFYVGVVQQPDAVAPTLGWIALDGQPVSGDLWGVYNSVPQPHDGSDGGATGSETDHSEQVAWVDLTMDALNDAPGTTLYAAVCECDGLAIHATAKQYLDSDPRKPMGWSPE
jgi:hypothetical protein